MNKLFWCKSDGRANFLTLTPYLVENQKEVPYKIWFEAIDIVNELQSQTGWPKRMGHHFDRVVFDKRVLFEKLYSLQKIDIKCDVEERENNIYEVRGIRIDLL